MGLLVSACPGEDAKIDCARVAVPLLSRCDQRFSKAEPFRCLSTYQGEDSARFARADAFNVSLCELIAPDGDDACYLESSCQEIEMGVCTVPGSLRASIDETCRTACEQAVVSCLVPCTATGSADACEDCVLACESERIACFQRCPLASAEE